MSSSGRTPTYFDSCSLMYTAEARVQTASARIRSIEPVLWSILDDPQRLCACSELTLIELHNTLATHWRDTARPGCDQEWVTASTAVIHERVSDGRLVVLDTPPKAIEHVMSLVTIATADRRALRAWDALHVVVAAQWSYSSGQAVEIVTTDPDFDAALEISGLGRYVSLLNLDVAAGTGEGRDRSRRG